MSQIIKLNPNTVFHVKFDIKFNNLNTNRANLNSKQI